MAWDEGNPYVYGDRGVGNYGYTHVSGDKYISQGFSTDLEGKKYRRATVNFDWQEFSYWSRYHSICRKYVNDTGSSIKYDIVKVRSCSGNSIDSQKNPTGEFYSYSAETESMHVHEKVTGLACTLFVIIRVSNDGEQTWASSEISEVEISRVSYNMNYKGSDSGRVKDSAEFGGGEYFDTSNGLTYYEFNIENCPVLEPNGVMYLHWGIKNAYWNSSETMNNGVLRVLFGSNDIEVIAEQYKYPYIWRRGEDGKWHLRRPSYSLKGDVWKSMDGDDD